MTILDVWACQPIAANSPPDWRTALGQILVRVRTAQGATGYGVGGGGAAGVHVVNTVLRASLVGREVEPVEEHWRRMYDATLPFGRKGIAIMALSGVDLALWDLRGKSAEKSVTELLGGTVGRAVPVYTTVWDAVDPQTAAQPQAVKLHVHVRPDQADGGPAARRRWIDALVRAVEAAREAIGPSRELMVDAWMEWDVEMTLAIAERIAPLGIGWIEEPLPVDDLAGYAELCRHSPVPIAGGEHEFTAAGFRELIDRRAHHVLQPDVCWAGGMTQLVEIYQLVRQANAAGEGHQFRVVPHRGGEVWGLPAVAALDPQPLAESGRPWMTWVGGQPSIVEGMIAPTTGPGFGVQIDEATLPMRR